VHGFAVCIALALDGDPYWTSSEASETFAWYQLFNDGTQFTDANGIIRGLAGNKSLSKSNVHTGSSFPAKQMQIVTVSAFAPKGSRVATEAITSGDSRWWTGFIRMCSRAFVQSRGHRARWWVGVLRRGKQAVVGSMA